MPIDLDQLAAACRENDRQVESGVSVDDVLRSLGAEPDGAEYVVRQRALRIVFHLRGTPMPAGLAIVKLTRDEAEMESLLAAACLDGIAIGLRAAREG